jgi:hypothetical protein
MAIIVFNMDIFLIKLNNIKIGMSPRITTSRKKPTRGFILMLDALGISSYSTAECHELLGKFNQLKTKLNEKNEGVLGIFSFKFVLFGDTVIIYVPIDSDFESTLSILTLICIQIPEIFEWGFKNKILFRGSIAIGDYFADENFIFGPAMFDANNWCEVADWFGIIFTPKSRLWIEAMMEKLSQTNTDDFCRQVDFDPYFIEYDVPLSKPINNAKTKSFLTYNWPKLLFVNNSKNETTFQTFLNLIYEIPMSREGETKIANGVKYFKDMNNI